MNKTINGMDILKRLINNLPEKEREKFLNKFSEKMAIAMIRATQA